MATDFNRDSLVLYFVGTSEGVVDVTECLETARKWARSHTYNGDFDAGPHGFHVECRSVEQRPYNFVQMRKCSFESFPNFRLVIVSSVQHINQNSVLQPVTIFTRHQQ